MGSNIMAVTSNPLSQDIVNSNIALESVSEPSEQAKSPEFLDSNGVGEDRNHVFSPYKAVSNVQALQYQQFSGTPKQKLLKPKFKESSYSRRRARFRSYMYRPSRYERDVFMRKRAKLEMKCGRPSNGKNNTNCREIPESPLPLVEAKKYVGQNFAVSSPELKSNSAFCIRSETILRSPHHPHNNSRNYFEWPESFDIPSSIINFNLIPDSNQNSRRATVNDQVFQIPTTGSEIGTETNNMKELSFFNAYQPELISHNMKTFCHDSTSSEDEGEGINGIGFKPTPAEADARLQKRKEQILAYKIRETREARRLRCERRNLSKILHNNTRELERISEPKRTRRVRFLDEQATETTS